MTHREKVERFRQDLGERSFVWWDFPPLYLLLWKLGVRLKPPLFQSFAVLVAIWVTFMLTALVLPTLLFRRHGSSAPMLSLQLCIATVCGFVTATLYRWRARHLELSSWERYPNESAADVFS